MATTKPRTNVKRPAASRSVRVTKKKQGVSKKQAFILVAVLAVVGVVAVVASRAATAPNNVYVTVASSSGSPSTESIVRVASDKSKTTVLTPAYGTSTYTTTLSRDMKELASINLDTVNILNSSTAARQTSMRLCDASVSSSNCNFNGGSLSWLPGNTTLIGTDSLGTQIYTIAEGSSARKVLVSATPTKGGSVTCPTVQPRGSKVAYLEYNRSADDFYRIITMNSDGSNRVAVYRSNYRDAVIGCPSWSTDGARLSFARKTTGTPAIVSLMVMNTNGSSVRSIATLFNGGNASYPLGQAGEDFENTFGMNADNSGEMNRIWSPGSSTMLVARQVNGVKNLYQLNVSTKKLTAVTSNTSRATSISLFGWSPDGRIVYAYNLKGNRPNTVKSVKSDGSSARILYQATGTKVVNSVSY
jgi:hypothetical protein